MNTIEVSDQIYINKMIMFDNNKIITNLFINNLNQIVLRNP